MAFEHPGNGALDYQPCRYGASRQVFRGPKKNLDTPFAAFLGGTETYGRFIEVPFPDLIEAETGHRCVNLGCVNAGIDVYAHDSQLLEIAADSRVTVVQVMGAQNLSNRFYTVHPRRNDRFVRPSGTMKGIFPEVDFTEFAFTRHLLKELRHSSKHQFGFVVDELKSAWVARMKLLIEALRGPIVLLWLADHVPPSAAAAGPEDLADPLFVDRAMIDEIRPLVNDYVQVVSSDAARAAGTAGMIYSELEAPAAMETPGVMVHRQVADALAPVIERHMTAPRPGDLPN